MRKPILIISLLLLALGISGQVERPRNLTAFDLKRIHFGFTVGVNSMDVGFTRNYAAEDFVYADLSHPLPGFQVSIVSDLRLNENWNLRFLPGISFGSREIWFYEYNDGVVGEPIELPNVDNPVPLGPAFLDFPLHFKYRSIRVNNYRPYLVGGLNFRFDMSAKKPGYYDTESNEYIKFNRGDLYLEFGFGVDNYLRYFKFAPELKLAVGLLNIADSEGRTPHFEFAESIASARSFILMLNFHFE
jgi:Outer membrane protein beta-barrel domain